MFLGVKFSVKAHQIAADNARSEKLSLANHFLSLLKLLKSIYQLVSVKKKFTFGLHQTPYKHEKTPNYQPLCEYLSRLQLR